MNKIFPVLHLLSLVFISLNAGAQTDSFRVEEARRIIGFLASDSLKGRANFSNELGIAAEYIAASFAKDSLLYYPGTDSYKLPFMLERKVQDPENKQTKTSEKVVHYNVVGILPGKTKAGEAIIFSSHYDHIGFDQTGRRGVYNGANDNASGTAAVMMLAHYYKQRNDNERTLIFIAFSGEELGLLGSKHFVNHIACDKVVAMVNLEMIGRANRKRSFFITGSHYSDLERIFRKNLKGNDVRIVGEPDQDRRLFMRSDNFPFASKGVPAHTIMASDDTDPCYHQECDELERLDLENMMKVIKAIVSGVRTLVDGTVTPYRINPDRIY